jgi:hypothetical protein
MYVIWRYTRSLSKQRSVRSPRLCHRLLIRSLILNLSSVLTDIQRIEQVFNSLLLVLKSVWDQTEWVLSHTYSRVSGKWAALSSSGEFSRNACNVFPARRAHECFAEYPLWGMGRMADTTCSALTCYVKSIYYPEIYMAYTTLVYAEWPCCM